MTSADPVVAPVVPPVLVAPSGRVADTHALGEAIADLAARLHAATYELLALLQQFDAQHGWNTGFVSCAHWLHWRTGIDLGAAREKVRVARALPALPRISASMAAGQLSYAKARAMTRVATPSNEQVLLDVALAGTAAHVERFTRAWRRVDEAVEERGTNRRHQRRHLSTWVDDGGMVVIRGRLTPEVGAVVLRALEAAADRLFRDSAAAAVGDSSLEEVSHAQRRADALGLLAEAALSADLDGGSAGDRYQVVVHVSAETPSALVPGPSVEAPSAHTGEPAIELEQCAHHVSAETSRRLACDASVVHITHDSDGRMLDVGRKTRTIPPAIRRALAARDSTCRFPGCTSRRCDAHHIEHWADGGRTNIDNLVLLCRRHHRAVHEGGFRIRRTEADGVEVLAPNGKLIPTLPPSVASAPAPLRPATTGGSPVWDGTPFDVTWAIDVLYRPGARSEIEKEEEEGCGSCGNRSVISKELVGALPG